MLGAFPARGMIRAWLKAGVVEQGRLHRTEDGVPQGGVVSPVLLNIALHGMEQAAGVRYLSSGSIRDVDSPTVIRYADDLVALCHTRQDALEIKAQLAKWLAPRGLAFNEDKTRVVTLDEGFDFLGFNVRRYRGKLLIKPSKAAVRRIRARLRDRAALPAREQRSRRDQTAQPDHPGMGQLLPDTRSGRDLRRTRPPTCGGSPTSGPRSATANKPKSWVTARYFGQFNKARQDRWVFGDRHSGAYMHRFAWTNIVRHQLVKQRSVTRRPRAGRLLGLATAQADPADQQHHPAAPQSPGRSLPDLQDPALRRRPAATNPKRLGAVADQHPHDDHDRPAGDRHAGHG